MRKLLLTGGPYSGKSTAQSVLQDEFHSQIVAISEVATRLLSSGFSIHGKDLDWSNQ